LEEDEELRKAKKPELLGEDDELAADLPLAEGEEDLADLEEADDAIVGDDDEAFIEPEEEDAGDVSDILGDVGEDEEEER